MAGNEAKEPFSENGKIKLDWNENTIDNDDVLVGFSNSEKCGVSMSRQRERKMFRWSLFIAIIVPVVFSSAGHCCCLDHDHADHAPEWNVFLTIDICDQHPDDCDCCCECDGPLTDAVGDISTVSFKRCCKCHSFVTVISGIQAGDLNLSSDLFFYLSMKRLPVRKLHILYRSLQI